MSYCQRRLLIACTEVHAEHEHLKNDFKEDEKYHYLVSQHICSFLTCAALLE